METYNAKDSSLNREDYRFKALFVGPSGSGKTTLACTLGKTLLIDVDNRADSISGFENVEVANCDPYTPLSATPWLSVKRIAKELWQMSKKDFPYDTIIWDGITALNRLSMQYALTLDTKYGLGGVPAMQHYLPQMKEMSDLILGQIPLPCNVIFTAHLEMHKDKELEIIKMLPKITGNTRDELSGWFNETWRFSATTKGYFINTIGFGREDFYKSALNQGGKYWTSPLEWDIESGLNAIIDLRFKKEK